MRKCFVCGTSKQSEPERQIFEFPKDSFFYLCDKHIPPELRTKFTLKPDSHKELELLLRKNNLFPKKLNNCVPKCKRKSLRPCILRHCNNSNKTCKLFKFPDTKSEYEVWVKNCLLDGDEEKKRFKYLCETHFDARDILKRKLRKGAVPLFNLSISNIEKVEPTGIFTNNHRNSLLPDPSTHSAVCYDLPSPDIVDVNEYQPLSLPPVPPLQPIRKCSSIMDELKTELPNMCHLCLIPKPNMLKLPSLEPPHLNKLTTMFERITSTPFEISNAYAQQLCLDCESNLHLISNIRDDFVRANNWWKTYLESLSARNENSVEFEVKFVPVLECFENGTDSVAVQHDDTRSTAHEMPPLLYFDTKDQEDMDKVIKIEILDQHGDPLTFEQGHGTQSFEPTVHSSKINKSRHIASDIRIKKPRKTPLKKPRRRKLITMYCDICLTRRNVVTTFQNKNHLRAHVKTHVNVCNICTDCFVTRSELYSHQRMCFQLKRNECDWCDAKMTKNVREHALEHHPDAVWPECEKCGAKFAHKRDLMQHWRNHMREKKFKCRYCDKAFINGIFLTHHERVHTNERPYICEICGMTFRQVTPLKTHILMHANRKHLIGTLKGRRLSSLIQCSLCVYYTNHIPKFYRHMVTKHDMTPVKDANANRIKYLYCVECKRFFEDTKSRREHSQQHLQFRCDFCMRRFKDLDAVASHMRIHSQTQRPFVCDICRASFACSANLRRHHRLIHNREFLFKCDQCPRSYLENYQLSKHKRSEHLNIKPILKCTHCIKEFQSKKGLTYHLKIHHTYTDPI